MSRVVSISGYDPTCGAGLGVDLKVFSSLGVFGAGVLTSVITQDKTGVISIETLSGDEVSTQLKTIMKEVKPDVVKIGTPGSMEVVECISDELDKYRDLTVVWDPVVRASAGGSLLTDGTITGALKLLSENLSLITPNYDEFCEIADASISSRDELLSAMLNLSKKENYEILTTGFSMEDDYVYDCFTHNGDIYLAQETPFQKDFNYHGTGCILSSAIASNLSKGYSLPDSIIISGEYLREIIDDADDGWLLPVGRPQYRESCIERTRKWLEVFLNELNSIDNLRELLPEIGTNLSVIPYRNIQTRNDVVTLSSRIISGVFGHLITGYPTVGSSYYTARLVLRASEINPEITVAMNIKYDHTILGVCKSIGLDIVEVKKRNNDKNTSNTGQKDFNETLSSLNKVPDCLYSTGDFGIEAMIILFATDLDELLEVISSISSYS